MATNVTNGWWKWIGVLTVLQWIFGVNLKKFGWELLCREHTRKNKVGPLVAINVTNWWWKYTGVWSMVQRLFGVNLENIDWKLRDVRHIQENWTWSPSGQKWNCRVPKIKWPLGLGLRKVWCEFEKRSVENSGVYSVYKKQPNLAPWWPQMEPHSPENQ